MQEGGLRVGRKDFLVLIGSKTQLAMEYEIVPSVGSVVLGHFCMWAEGTRIGNFEDVVVLTAVQAQVERSLGLSGTRTNLSLFEGEKNETTRVLVDALYGKGGDDDISFSLSYRGFNLTDLGISSFDGIYVFLVDSDAGQRLLWRKINDVKAIDAYLPQLTFEGVARDYLEKFIGRLKR
jgi:hypothetical protein